MEFFNRFEKTIKNEIIPYFPRFHPMTFPIYLIRLALLTNIFQARFPNQLILALNAKFQSKKPRRRREDSVRESDVLIRDYQGLFLPFLQCDSRCTGNSFRCLILRIKSFFIISVKILVSSTVQSLLKYSITSFVYFSSSKRRICRELILYL